ncbi:MAG TPA: hypothetical protein VLZ83_00940 [Edaphocola sp.]|nr:hypothetical protein [Edaphocola sp.]
MKKVSLYIIVSLGLLLSSCYRETINPHPPNNNTFTFVDEFNDNRNDWAFADQVNDAYGVIDRNRGTFSFNYLDPMGIAYYRSKTLNFNPDRDFVVTTKIGSDNLMGLLLGFDDASGVYGYSFTVDYDGNFALWDEGSYNRDISAIINTTNSNAVNLDGDWNEVSIRQEGTLWKGYINGVRVFAISAPYLNKGSLGFMIVGDTRGEADYIEATYY